MLSNLIVDRTLLDYSRWLTLRNKGYADMTEAERAEFATDMKGAYNASDLNRVGNALNYLRDKLTAAGYLGGNEFTAVTSWTVPQIPTAEQFSYYLNAVETIRAAMSRKVTTPATPKDTGSLDIEGANAIERILLDIDELLNNMLAARYYLNDLYSGEI